MMKNIKAIGFDLFGTLIFVNKLARGDALQRLLKILREHGFDIEQDAFVEVYLARYLFSKRKVSFF